MNLDEQIKELNADWIAASLPTDEVTNFDKYTSMMALFDRHERIIRELQAEVKRLEQIIESTKPKEKN